jgi:hypothetical protein
LSTNQINDLTKDDTGRLYSATDAGVFVLTGLDDQNYAEHKGPSGRVIDFDQVTKEFENEPDIKAVQRLAIRYAEVHPDKINNWRRSARLRALVPSLSAGIGRSATDLFHWDTGQNPDNLVSGREYLDWDVGLSWDLGDMIWSTDQTTIDSRSKLMVELREDILDQVTRLYFERRRLQIELLQNDLYDPQLALDKRMRVAELTALIDGYTGGEFSQKLERSKEVME